LREKASLPELPGPGGRGDRSTDAIDAGRVLPGYAGVIVRDGYYGYRHLTDALHAWCEARLLSRYRALATGGLAANVYRRTATAEDARRIARRFLNFEDTIPRFATRPDLDIFTNNEAQKTIRPVKVQQRSSGGCRRTIEGLADFTVTQSYPSTAAKWGISKLDALRDLFNGHARVPPGPEPAG
jgi:transposase